MHCWNLYDLAIYLLKKESEGGLECISALNLSGDSESGLYVHDPKEPFTDGNIDVPIASAIAFFKKWINHASCG